MIRVIGILAWVAPGDVHFTRRQVNDHSRDRILTVKRIDSVDVVIANGVRQIDMVLLDRL